MSEQTIPENRVTTPIQFIHFHGLVLVAVEYENIQYIPVKPLVNLIGTNWRSARRALFNGDNPELFGTIDLFRPVFDGSDGDNATQMAAYIRLDRSQMYLARIDTTKMRSNGNENAANALLKLQIEWAEALHSYETNGIAFKYKARDKELFNLIHKLDSVKNSSLKTIYAQQLNNVYGLNIPIANQSNLDL